MLVDLNTEQLTYLQCQHNRKGHETVLSPKNYFEHMREWAECKQYFMTNKR